MKIIKNVSIAFGALVALLAVLSGFYGLRMNYELKKMRPDDTKELVEGIYAIKDDTYINMHLIKVTGGYIAIDAAQHEDVVEREMAKFNIDPQMVRAVLLTHSDYDHVGAIKLFENATVYISAAEEQMINGKTARAAFIHKNKLNSSYTLITDNQVLNVTGLKVQGILTPGHTPGSMSYLIDDKYLFTGDTLSLKNKKAEISSEFFNMDTTAVKKSIAKLAAIPGIEYIFTAHFGHTDNAPEAFKSWRENL